MDNIRLPKNIPLFPLPGVLLLPGGILPLNIFEPRYLQMFRDAMETDGIIGMIQPRQEEARNQDPELFSTGCAGQVIQHEETSDGRVLLSLRGLCRFEIVNEHENDRLYRTVEVDYLPSGNVLKKELETRKKKRLMNAVSLYLPLLESDVEMEPILEAGVSELSTVLSMHCPFSSNEKQSLLEADNMEARVDMLIQLLEQATLQSWTAPDQPVN
jgi:hypothetical protein